MERVIRVPRGGRAFAEGMARAIDFGGVLGGYQSEQLLRMYEELRMRRLDGLSGVEAEAEVVKVVWGEVGECIWNAIGVFESRDEDGRLPAERQV